MAFPHGSNPQREDTTPMTKMPIIKQEWKYEKNKIALPTVGRVVYYYHPSYGGQPLAAIVAAVIPASTVGVDGYTVNLGVLNPDGTGGPAMNVPHESERVTSDTPYWDWMPFQKGQAAKNEELQAELDRKAMDATSVTPYAGGQGSVGAMEGYSKDGSK